MRARGFAVRNLPQGGFAGVPDWMAFLLMKCPRQVEQRIGIRIAGRIERHHH